MIANRYAPAFCILAGIALVPTVIHSYLGVKVADGRSTAAISRSLAGFRGTATTRNATWGQRRFESEDWTERKYVAGADEAVLTIVRTYDPKTVYHHPELAVAYGTTFQPEEIRRLPEHPDIPIHVLKPAPPGRALGMYVLEYESRFVENPLVFQLRTMGELLVAPRKPMTLFFVSDPRPRDIENVASLGSTALLLAAIEEFAAQRVGTTK